MKELLPALSPELRAGSGGKFKERRVYGRATSGLQGDGLRLHEAHIRSALGSSPPVVALD